MPDFPTFTGPGGSDPFEFTLRMVHAAKPNIYDAMYGGEVLQSKIWERTALGLDCHANMFDHYAISPPYYYYPTGKVGKLLSKLTTKTRQGQRDRTFRALGKVGERTHLGIKFPGGYSQFKHEGLGRSYVDLMGPRGPHMLERMQVRIPELGSSDIQMTMQGDVWQMLEAKQQMGGMDAALASTVEIGWWGEEALRAKGNNEGTGRNKVRNFFPVHGLPDDYRALMENAIAARIAARLQSISTQ